MISEDGGRERAAELEAARKIALDQLATRARSEHELRQCLARRKVSPAVADEVINRLVDVGLIDDAAFAQALASSRAEYGLRGRARIRQELQAKGVERHVADDALAELDPDDEREAALTLARRRIRSMGALDARVARRRLAGVLARRGFSSDIVRGTVEAVMGMDWQDEVVEFSTGDQ